MLQMGSVALNENLHMPRKIVNNSNAYFFGDFHIQKNMETKC